MNAVLRLDNYRRLAVFVQADEGQIGFGHRDGFVLAEDFDIDMHTDRCPSDTRCICVEAHHFSHVHRRFELHFFDGDRDYTLSGDLGAFDGSGQIDITQDDAAKDSALTVGISWLKNDTN